MSEFKFGIANNRMTHSLLNVNYDEFNEPIPPSGDFIIDDLGNFITDDSNNLLIIG